MAIERTLALIKPDAVESKIEGDVIAMISKSGLAILQIKKVHLTQAEAALFYAVHDGKPFFADLTSFISSGSLYALALEGENAVVAWRTLMGATNPADAAEGTVRKRFGKAINRNVVHGSDSVENARIEMGIFFSELEYVK